VAQLAEERGARVVAEFVEVESWRKSDRPQLAAALVEARKKKAAIAVAKLDRLARDAELILRLSREAESNGMGGFLLCDLPDIDATTAAGRLILGVMGSVAEFESRRTQNGRRTPSLQLRHAVSSSVASDRTHSRRTPELRQRLSKRLRRYVVC